jgi:hypothetical protein
MPVQTSESLQAFLFKHKIPTVFIVLILPKLLVVHLASIRSAVFCIHNKLQLITRCVKETRRYGEHEIVFKKNVSAAHGLILGDLSCPLIK